jgi:hypothetical protein
VIPFPCIPGSDLETSSSPYCQFLYSESSCDPTSLTEQSVVSSPDSPVFSSDVLLYSFWTHTHTQTPLTYRFHVPISLECTLAVYILLIPLKWFLLSLSPRTSKLLSSHLSGWPSQVCFPACPSDLRYRKKTLHSPRTESLEPSPSVWAHCL